MLDLNVFKHLGHGVDGAGRNTHLVEGVNPLHHGLAFEDFGQFGVQAFAVLHAQCLVGELWIAQPVGARDQLAQPHPVTFAGRAQVEHAVAGLEQSHRAAGGMVVAHLHGNVLVVEVTGALKVHHGDLRMQQGGMNPLPLAGDFALQQSRQDAQRRIQAGTHVGHRQAGAHGSGFSMAGDRHQAAHALQNLVKTRSPGVRAVLTKTRDAGQDDARVHGRQRGVIHAQFFLHIGPPVFDHDIGVLDQPHQDVQGAGLFEVQGHRALVAVDVLEVAAAAVGGKHGFIGINARRGFDADDVCAEIGEHAHAIGAGANARQVQDAEPRQCLGGLYFGHWAVSLVDG